jgi:hypothetical protein
VVSEKEFAEEADAGFAGAAKDKNLFAGHVSTLRNIKLNN